MLVHPTKNGRDSGGRLGLRNYRSKQIPFATPDGPSIPLLPEEVPLAEWYKGPILRYTAALS
jgi:hypothetical protein